MANNSGELTLSTPSKPRSAEALANGYSSRYAKVNATGVLLATTLAIVAMTLIGLASSWTDGLIILCAVGAGLLTADLLTGLVHWACDTWGTTTIPLLGPTLIRSFREHHVDPMSITRHDWAEINGEACLAASPFLIALCWLGVDHLGTFGAWWALSTTVAAMVTNQFHQWAHMRHPPRLVKYAQKTGLILSVRSHARHHRSPFTVDYCITTGWLNRPLNAIGFWRLLERFISAATGALPREDDLGTETALSVQQGLQKSH